MIPTYIGVIIAIVGLILQAFPAELSLAFFSYCLLMGGSSAIDLNALGGASLPPANFALVFLLLRLGRKDLGRSEPFLHSLQVNGLIVVFALYCALSSFVLPRLFAGKMWVIAMGTSSLGQTPLSPTVQNITTAVYMLSTALVAVSATMLTYTTNLMRVMAKCFIIVTFIHIGTGLLGLALDIVHLQDLLYIVRNGHYAQLDQSFGEIHRISGIMPEPSVYATFGGACFVLMTEFWLRGFYARWSGVASISMLVTLVLSTSSTGYIFVAAYGGLLWFRFLFMPGSAPPQKLLTFVLVQIFGGALIFVVLAATPSLFSRIAGILQTTLINKASTDSGVQRSQWAMQGITVFVKSYGLGIGVGSFRSSSIITAILGSVGPLGLVAFLIYVLQAWQPFRRSTFKVSKSEALQFAAATGWAALLIIIAQAAVGASPDPGMMFGLFAGLSIGLRSRASDPAPGPVLDRRLNTASALA